jgi:CxxC-x17-CxxC domain-containing protein
MKLLIPGQYITRKVDTVYCTPLRNSEINMHQGNWKCSGCGGAITELPFMPRSEAGLTCRACYSKQKGGGAPKTPVMAVADEMPDFPFDADIASGPQMDDGFDAAPPTGEKPKISGDWSCANCGGSISSLPFTPRDTSNLKCLDCFKRSKA